MAELVLGLAQSAVEETLNIVKSAVEEEKKLQKSVKHDLMLISDEFEMMHSFLIAANKHHTTDDRASTLVRQVRNMALDVEDCIESVIHLDRKSNLWRGLLPSCIPAAAPVVALKEAAADIELLNARVEAMGKRKMRYNYNGHSSSNPDVMMHQTAMVNTTAFDMLVEARSSTNKQCGQTDLIKLIKSWKDGVLQLQVISVWGTASSVGMASIIKAAYEEPEISEGFRCRAWVKLMHPLNPHEIIRSMLIQFYKHFCPQQGSTAVDIMEPMMLMEATQFELIQELKKQTSRQRYLVILEDMFNMDDWDAIRAYLPDSNNGSCIIVHTQKLEIASLCVGHPYKVSELKDFSEYHSVCVFFKEDNKEKEDVRTTKQKAACAWLEKFQHVRVGREIDLNMFQRMAIISPTDREVLFVWGISGVGKSSVVKHVYSSEVLRQPCGFERFGWVNVCHPFSCRDLLWSLLLDLHSDSLQRSSMLRFKDPIQECRDLLHEHRCLVVIDGLRSTEEWHLIKSALEIGHSKSRIIVITNEENVAIQCAMQNNSVFNIKVLEADEVIDLFKKKVVYQKAGSPSTFTTAPEIDITQVLHKCGGLPEVIVAIADFLSGLGSESQEERTMMLNDNLMHELETNNQAFGSLRGLFSWVHSYFRTCPAFLKPCVFYLTIFPVNLPIRPTRLVRRWIAEGYSRDTKESTAEETAEEFFSQLVKLSIIQLLGSTTAVASYKRMPLCHVNGFFREYIISRSMEENLVFALEGRCSINSQRTGRHLAVASTWDRDRNVFDSIDLSRLRSLTVFGEWKPFFISDRMRMLRVLDLEDSSGVTNEDVEQMVKVLPRLKFLSLRRCRDISRLPGSLSGLRHLQSLDVRDTSIVKLPKSMIKLPKLQYIRAGTSTTMDDRNGTSLPAPPSMTMSRRLVSMLGMHTRHKRDAASSHNGGGGGGGGGSGVVVPGGIGQLIALHTLGVIDVSITFGRNAQEELKNLTQLHKFGVSGINRNNSKELFRAISSLGHLESLSVWLDEDSQAGCLDNVSQPPENLRSLKLYGLAGKLPGWISHLRGLRKLHLQMSTTLPQEQIDVLSGLRKLAILCLHFNLFPDGQLQFGTGFNELLLLEIHCKPRLQAITFPTSGFCNLEALKLRCYNVSSSLEFSGLEHLQELKEVWLMSDDSGTNFKALKEHLKGKLEQHPNEIKPVLRQGLHPS